MSVEIILLTFSNAEIIISNLSLLPLPGEPA